MVKLGLTVGANFRRNEHCIIDQSHCWLIKIGDNVVVGAGSVITKSIESNTVVAGNPAKTLSTYEGFINKNKELINISPCFDETYTLRNKKFSAEQKQQRKICY